MASIQIKYTPAENESVDPEFEMWFGEEKLDYSVQVCVSYGQGYALNEYRHDAEGNLTALIDHGTVDTIGEALDWLIGKAPSAH